MSYIVRGLTDDVSQPLTAVLDPKTKDGVNGALVTTSWVHHQCVRADAEVRGSRQVTVQTFNV